MHYGPSRKHPAEQSLRHRRDSKAGTKTLHHLRIYGRTKPLHLATTDRTGMLEHRHHRRIGRGRRTFPGTTGRASAADAAADRRIRRTFQGLRAGAGAAYTAADSAGAAEPSRDYGPDGGADGLSWSTPRQAYDSTTRPSGERADASVRCTGLGVCLSKRYIRRGLGRVPFTIVCED
jgi:hypothetical protein